MKKTISILGSTGSIGQQTLKIIEKKKFFFDIFLLSADKNFNEINRQIIKYNPKFFLVSNYEIYKKIKKKYKNRKINIINNLKDLKIKKKNEHHYIGYTWNNWFNSNFIFYKIY